MTKKVLFITVLLLLIFSLMVACNKDGSGTDSNNSKTDQTQTDLGQTQNNNDQNKDNIDQNKDDLGQISKAEYPLTLSDSANRSVIFAESPKRIATVNPADMEIIYAIGGEVVGRPQNSTGVIRPSEAAAAVDIGTPMTINYEKIAELKADLFIGHKRLNIKDVPTLEAMDLNVLLTQGDSLEEIKSLVEMYGKILDKKENADALVRTIENKVADIRADNKGKQAKVLILFGTPSETMAALPQSLAGNLFEIAGAENIFTDLPGLKAYPTYAQLSLERVFEADPDVIYFMSMGDAEKALKQFQSEMAAIPAWKELKAIKNDKLIILPHELFGANPGPRIIDSLQLLKDSLNNLGN